MEGARKAAQKVGGMGTPGQVGDPDPNVDTDTCPGCGRYMPLNGVGLCGTDECRDGRIVRAMTQGHVRTLGGTKYVLTNPVTNLKQEALSAEASIKNAHIHNRVNKREFVGDAPKCSYSGCDSIPRPNDTLCNLHRMEAKALDRKLNPRRIHAQESTDTELPSRRRKRGKQRFAKIRGMEKLRRKA